MKQHPQSADMSAASGTDIHPDTLEPSELLLLHQRIRDLEQQLAERQTAEVERLALLSERIRQELCFMVGIDRAFQPADEHALSDYQRQLLSHVSDTGRRILAVLEQLVEADLPVYQTSVMAASQAAERSC